MTRLFRTLVYCSPLFLAVLIYGYSITLPFFLDDGPHFQILAQTNGIEHWGDFPPFPFYRPFTFTFWKLYEIVTGGYHAPVLHTLNVLVFGLNGVILGQITAHLMPSDRRVFAAVIAGCGFVLFPFSYQAVVMVAAFFHHTLTLGLLLCLWAALMHLKGYGGRWMLLLCWSAAFMGVFSHENGILLAALLPGFLWVTQHILKRDALQRNDLIKLVLPVLIIVGVYAIAWWSFRPQEDTTLNKEPFVSMAALSQGMAFPVISAARPFVTGDAQPWLILVLVATTTILLILLASKSRQIALFGVGWYMLGILPAMIVLPAGYVLGQPRLALFASVGAGMVWAAALAVPVRLSLRFGLTVSILLIGIAISVEFLIQRKDEFLRLRNFNQAALTLFRENNTITSGAVLVNVPDYITPPDEDRRFLLGTEGALYVDETLDYNQQFWMNSTLDYHNIDVFALPEIQRNTGFGFRAHPPILNTMEAINRVKDAPQVYVTQFYGDGFYPMLVGGTDFVSDIESMPLATYPDDGIALQVGQATYADGMVTVRLEWQQDSPLPIKTFIHVYCDTEFIGQSDGYPWGDTYPFSAWGPNETQTDMRYVPVEVDDSSCLKVFAGLYNESTIDRLAAFDHSGSHIQDDAVQIPLIIEN